MNTNLDAAYDAVRAYLHTTTPDTHENRDALRSLLWITAEALERHGQRGYALRDLGDALTGVEPPRLDLFQ